MLLGDYSYLGLKGITHDLPLVLSFFERPWDLREAIHILKPCVIRGKFLCFSVYRYTDANGWISYIKSRLQIVFFYFVRCAKVVKTIGTKVVYSLSIVVDCSETFSLFKKPKGGWMLSSNMTWDPGQLYSKLILDWLHTDLWYLL